MFPVQPHRQQFVLGPEAFCVYEDWCCRQLDMSTWVSHCPELRAGWTNDANGTLWGLFGLAVETRAERPEPLAQIALAPTTNVPDLYDGWAGRWVLINRHQVHVDASGLLACFYGKATDSRTWISSSPALLTSIVSPDVPAVDPRQLRYQMGISWFTPPRSRFAGIYRLLPSQVINCSDGSIRPRPLMPPINPSLGFDETLEMLKHSLVTTLQRLPTKDNKPWLGLTAGFDSRLMLAIARCAGIDVGPFTRVSARMSVADRLLPPNLARECGYEHIFLRGRQVNSDRKQLVAEHSAGHVSDGDAQPFIQGVRDDLEGISFGGHGFAIASGFANLRRLPDTVIDPKTGAQQIAQLFGEPTTSTATAGIHDWLKWVLANPLEHLDWRDRFFIEQRQAGWLSSKEQLYDLTRLERFPILNAARNYALLLGLEDNQRFGSVFQTELIRKIMPGLLKYPFNPPDKYFGILRAALIKSSDDPLHLYRKLSAKLRRRSLAATRDR